MSSSLDQRTVDAVRRLGLARPRDLTRLGLRREYVQRLTERGALVRVARGLYAIPDAEMGARKLDIPRMYNTKRYRPHYAGQLGLPMFLTSVVR